MSESSEKITLISDYQQQVETYEHKRKIYDDNMRLWETCDKTSSEMDARFDKVLFTIAAGSFGISFAFIDNFVPIGGVWPCCSGRGDPSGIVSDIP